MPKKKSTQRGRDAGSGRFIPIPEARRRKKTATVENIALPGKKPKRKS